MPRARRDPNSPAYIYGLYDPRTGELRYIGQSVSPENRLRSHIYYHDNGPKSCWVRKLLEMGLKPIMSILEEIKYKDINSRERYWIHQKRKEGASLLNLTDGGDRPPETTAESAKKSAEKRRGRTDSPEAIENKKKAQKDRVARDGMNPNLYTPEANQKRSLRLKYLYETGQKRRGITLSPEAQAIANQRRSDSLRGRQMATREEYIQRGIKISSTVEDQWEQGHYDYRAKTGPKSDKEGRIYPEDHQDIVDMYLAGYTQNDIAIYYDVERSNVGKLLGKLGVYKEKVDHVPEIIRLYTEENWTTAQIANHLQMSSDNVLKKLKNNGVTIKKSLLTAEMVAEAHRRESNGEKRKDIAAEYNVTAHALGERIRRYRESLER